MGINDRMTSRASATMSTSSRDKAISVIGRPISVLMKLNTLVAVGVNFLMRKFKSRKTVAMRVLSNKFWISFLAASSSSILLRSSALTVSNSSLIE